MSLLSLDRHPPISAQSYRQDANESRTEEAEDEESFSRGDIEAVTCAC